MPNDSATGTQVSVDSIETTLNELKSEFEQAVEGQPIEESFLTRLEACCLQIQQLTFDNLSSDDLSKLEQVLNAIKNLTGVVEQQKSVIEKNIDVAKNQKKVRSAYSI